MRHRGLSPSSVKKYYGAVCGVISDWAIDNGLIHGSLLSLKSQAEFEIIESKIRALTIYKERNKSGHHMYSSALLKFSEYLSEGNCSDIELDIDEILSATDIGETEKSSLIKSRIGQGIFR